MATGAWQATVHGVAKSWARLSNFQYTPQHIQVSCMLILHYQLSHKGSSRILQWVAHPFSSRSSQPRSKTGVSCIAGGFFNNWATREALIYITSVQFSRSVVSNSSQPHGLQHGQASLSITNSWSLLKLMSIESVMPSSHLILCLPLLLPHSINFQHSCLENSLDRGAWQATVHEATKSHTWLSD